MKRNICRRMTGLVAVLALAGPLTACAQGDDSGAACGDGTELSIAYQPGLGYANLRLVKAEKLLEKELPDTKITWRELNSGAAIRDGTMSGDIDIAAGGVGPFIIGRAAGVDWKMLSALNTMNLQLMVMDKNVNSLEQLKGDGKIAMPGPDSIQAIVLKKGAKEELGDARELDAQILAMGHPDGVQALSAGQIDAHLTSPPFLQQEVDEGAHDILSSYDLFDGAHTFNGVYAKEEFVECRPEVSEALLKTLGEANTRITDESAESAEILSQEIGGMKPDAVERELKAEGTEFTQRPVKVTAFSDFMFDEEIITEKLTTDDMFFDNHATTEGS